MAGAREESRARTTAAILGAARAEIAEHGGGGLSMRAVAREVGMVSSAVYRYFPTREALLTAMILESYGSLADALRRALDEATDEEPTLAPGARWAALGHAFRGWARARPHEFQLIYGTPVPGYVAPPETVPAAAAVARPFLEVGAGGQVAGYDEPALVAQMSALQQEAPGAEPSGAAAVLAELAALVGLVSLELAGHLVGTADPADHLVDALLERQAATLGLGRG
ncbi:TetR/AcrR family transcriptional regulator [Janibacter alkaliphilus]|uniref:AcrR family transcriptional regulator n=1 Tax=Janibacter alkaliphilus TaxID=1069963 RepID=A0A852X4U1_9MICO|nr:TetR/AcrR family transcriptional regulator [Janibacter alkaliphilus]NYG36370.1 AcrR family transcriptional regulator [Janibacter alkaliphilus]